ncbi:MAG: head GIN domain-containing protein [Cytophagales bacterium]
MKQSIFLLFIVLMLLDFQMSLAQKVKGSGNIIKVERDIEAFTGLRTRSFVDVELVQGPFKLEIEAEDNIIEYVETRVVKENLIIEMDEDVKIKTEKPVKIYLQLPDLKFAEVSEVSKLSTKSVIKIEELSIEATGASKSNFILDVKTLRISLSGSSSLRATGYAVRQKIKMEEASKYEASQLKSEDIDIAASSASKAEILAFNSIFGDLSEASQCVYYGEPKKVDVTTSDAASISQLK